MGNENSKTEQQQPPPPEPTDTEKLSAIFADIKAFGREFDERRAVTANQTGLEDGRRAAAILEGPEVKTEAASEEEEEARSGSLLHNVQDTYDNAAARHIQGVEVVEVAAAVEAPEDTSPQDTLAGWNPRKEPRRKSSSANSQTGHRRPPGSPDVESLGMHGNQETPAREKSVGLNEAVKRKDSEGSAIAPTEDIPAARPVLQETATKTSMKRIEPASGFVPSGRRDISGPHMPKRARPSIDSITSPPRSPATAGGNDIDPEPQPPEWYRKMSLVAKRGTNTGNADALLDRLKDQIAVIKKIGPSVNAEELNKLRESLHEAPFLAMGAAGPQLLRNKRLLHNNDGLPQLFDDRYAGSMKGHWPWDIKSDAEEMYHRWSAKNFDDDMLFGIILAQRNRSKNGEDDRKGDTVDKNRQVSSKYTGNGNLVNGQWWPTLLCALRDGAHGDSQAGISGDTNVGAYSCFISGGKYHIYPDKDEGDVVYYYGQDATIPGESSRGTSMLKRNKVNRIPVRFIRSSKAASHSRFAPPIGFRYDGLYDVVSYELKDKAKERYCFKLVRQPGQGPIRGGDGPEARPTRQEIERFKQDRRFRGL